MGGTEKQCRGALTVTHSGNHSRPLRMKHEQTQLLELVGRKDSHGDGEGGEAPVSKALLGMLSTGRSLSVAGRYGRAGV